MSSQPPQSPSDSELMPPPPRPLARTQTTGTAATPTTVPDSDSNSGTDTAVPPSTPHARTRISKHSTERMLNDLRSSLQGYQANVNFCCGGSIPIQDVPARSSGEPITVPPIVLRFDNPYGAVSKLRFPLGNDHSGLADLLRACTPMKSESRRKGILDETYRNVGELDRSSFSLDFHPQDYGIIDTIAQILLPGIDRPIADGNLDSREEHWGVRAELDKLIIHSAPLDKFPKNMNAPQSALQFGTLIICLPTFHQGSQLHLTHKSHHSMIDWSRFSPNTIKWSAFHTPCKTDLLPLTAGHRVSLTYNLFICQRVGGALNQQQPTADPSLYPLYKTVKSLLGQQDFLPDGGTLAHPLTHPLSHTTRNFPRLLPFSLRGLDATVYSVFSSLGLSITIRPIFGEEAWDEWDQWKMEFERGGEEGKERTRVGEFGRIRMLDEVLGRGGEPTAFLTRYMRLQELDNVIWLNEAIHEGWEVQVVHLKEQMEDEDEDGKDMGLMWHYSSTVMFIEVRKWSERVGQYGGGKGKERE